MYGVVWAPLSVCRCSSDGPTVPQYVWVRRSNRNSVVGRCYWAAMATRGLRDVSGGGQWGYDQAMRFRAAVTKPKEVIY